MDLSPRAKEELCKAGWLEGRSVGVEQYEVVLKSKGYEVFPAALAFANIYGGLKGLHRAYTVDKMVEEYDFDCQKVANSLNKNWVDKYARRAGEALVPIGEAYTGYFTVLVSKSGRIMGGFDDFLCLMGESIEEGINSLFERVEYQELPRN